MVPEVEVAAGRAIADRVIADRLALGGDNIVVGVEVEGELALPRGVSLFGVAVHEEVGAYIACGLDDDFKTRLDAGGTVLGLEFAEFARRSGIAAEDCIAGDGTLWDARLWCAAGSEDRFSRVRWMWESVGSQVTEMAPDRHDRVLAVTSHLPHLIAYTIVATAADLEEHMQGDVIKYSAGGFRDFTRIAASDPVMWRDVFLHNREAVLEMLGRLYEDIAILQRAIRIGDGDVLESHFIRSRAIRRGVVALKQD
jgi:hypothetical protein